MLIASAMTNRVRRLFPLALLAALLGAAPAFGQRDVQGIPDPDPALEQKALQVAAGFEINLYAADPLLAKPIQMNFDPQGRLWIASSEVYPQIKPGQVANDKILVLEDLDDDGRADKTTVFAQGLLIPTGVAPGDGGAYVANSTQLLHLKDTDGDGQADQRRVMLSGFGTEDTHHLLHTLRWGPDGLLYMNQSIYIHSHVETPYGVRRMNGGGIWHFRPETGQLEAFVLGFINPWGHEFDRYGQSIVTDGAGNEGLNHVFPGFVGVTSPGAPRVLHGLNPGSPKHCGLAIASGRHLPEDWQGDCITNDFRAHRVCRFKLSERGSSFSSQQLPELIRSRHVAFRPIDVKIGPDGAIYVADWYNPIIQHGEVDFRDPRRDHTHGRIWRITAKGRPLTPRPQLVDQPVPRVLAALTSPEQYTRDMAKRVLKERGARQVLAPLGEWIAALDATDPQYEHHLLEGLWTYQSLDHVEPGLLGKLLAAENPNIRAAATRVVYHWHARLDNPLALLTPRASDEHPRVRLEAVRALSRLPKAEACPIAMRALDFSMDEHLDFALWQTARDLKPHWLPALEQGKLSFDNLAHLTFALKAVESQGVVPLVIKQLQDDSLDDEQRAAALATVAQLASPQELRTVLDLALAQGRDLALRRAVLEALANAAQRREVKPAGDLAVIQSLVRESDPALRRAALQLVGAWRVTKLAGEVAALAVDSQSPLAARLAAVGALGRLGRAEDLALLEKLLRHDPVPELRLEAARSLTESDLVRGARQAAGVLAGLPAGADPRLLVEAFLSKPEGPKQLAAALAGKEISGDVAKLALRTVRSSGAPHEELIAALSSAGKLQATTQTLSPEELARLLKDVQTHGDPARGEAVFRRAEQACLKCHAIGGAGGRVGPDLASIGASAQPDYLVESLLQPGAKIKEGYHSRIVMTDAGKVVTGVVVRETDSELILRDAEDRQLRVPLDEIVAARDGGSMMPAGLTDSLTRAEMIDLVRFLSELGKVGDYALGQQVLVRRWQTLEPNAAAAQVLHRQGLKAVVAAPGLTWRSVYSRVDGTLPTTDLPALGARGGALAARLVRFELEVLSPGKISLGFDSLAGLQLFVNDEPHALAAPLELDLPRGRHTLTLAVNAPQRTAPLRVELLPNSSTEAELISGK